MHFFLTRSFVMVLVVLSAVSTTSAQEIALEKLLDQLVADESLIAAQAVVGKHARVTLDHAVGVTSPGGKQEVNADTLFCIGSCSKPFASAIVMTLVEDGRLRLQQPIDHYLPSFGKLKLPGGEPSERAPTMGELLAHRSGIYSQKRQLTKRQQTWIRDFGLTLETAVNGISGEPLIARPGTEYHYSGAGYCVAGRVAEVVSKQSFEELFQNQIAGPLKLRRSTYFPNAGETNIAVGGKNDQPNEQAPHRAKSLRLPLIGGSLYSTAQETARFLRMVAERGKYDDVEVMTRDTWNTWVSRPYPEGNYGFGWGQILVRDQVAGVRHRGALHSSRSYMVVSTTSGVYGVVHFTHPPLSTEAMNGINERIEAAVFRSLNIANKR